MRTLAALLLGLTAVAATGAAWLQQPGPITATEAVQAAQGAFEAAGFPRSVVERAAKAGRYEDGEDGAAIDVWKTSAELDDGTVELWVARADGEPVFLDDRTPDGVAQILTDAQFQDIADHADDPGLARQVRRNIFATLAAAGVVCLAVLLVVLGRRSQGLA